MAIYRIVLFYESVMFPSVWISYACQWKTTERNFGKTFEILCRIHGKLHIWSYVNQALLQMNMPQYKNLPLSYVSVEALHIQFDQIMWKLGERLRKVNLSRLLEEPSLAATF